MEGGGGGRHGPPFGKFPDTRLRKIFLLFYCFLTHENIVNHDVKILGGTFPWICKIVQSNDDICD